MAEERMASNENSRSTSAETAGNSGGLVGAVISGLGKMWDAVMADGYIAAAVRQGFGELGEALKAFPDSIQVQEPGTIFNPTQGEIAADRAKDNGTRHPWPSEIAAENRNQPSKGNDAGYENGKDA